MVIKDLTSINETAKEFIAQMGDNRLFFFYGDMGAGKTTFIRAICKELGVTESVNSPTFAIVNEYTDREGKPIYHFDFYRIEKEEEAFDFGYEDYFFSGNLCFVEWPEKIENLIPNEGISVYIQEEENGERSVTLKEKV